MIEVKDIVKTYKNGSLSLTVLKGLNLSVKEGEYVAFMGPSGSGKSTFMNILGCLDRLTSGKYVLDGIDVSTMKGDELSEVRNEKIGFVFQTFNLLPKMSALENVALPALYAGLKKEERLKDVCPISLIVAKNRGGRVGIIKDLVFKKSLSMITDLEHETNFDKMGYIHD